MKVVGIQHACSTWHLAPHPCMCAAYIVDVLGADFTFVIACRLARQAQPLGHDAAGPSAVGGHCNEGHPESGAGREGAAQLAPGAAGTQAAALPGAHDALTSENVASLLMVGPVDTALACSRGESSVISYHVMCTALRSRGTIRCLKNTPFDTCLQHRVTYKITAGWQEQDQQVRAVALALVRLQRLGGPRQWPALQLQEAAGGGRKRQARCPRAAVHRGGAAACEARRAIWQRPRGKSAGRRRRCAGCSILTGDISQAMLLSPLKWSQRQKQRL